jgi:hypothetical protein
MVSVVCGCSNSSAALSRPCHTQRCRIGEYYPMGEEVTMLLKIKHAVLELG